MSSQLTPLLVLHPSSLLLLLLFQTDSLLLLLHSYSPLQSFSSLRPQRLFQKAAGYDPCLEKFKLLKPNYGQ